MGIDFERDRPADEIAPAMIQAGAKILEEKMDSGPYWARVVARDVFMAMWSIGQSEGWPKKDP